MSASPGERTPGLELDQGGRDQQELGGDLEVEVLQTVQFGHIAIHDATQRDLVEVHLFVEDEVQEEVERPLEDLGLHVVGHDQSVITHVWFVHPCSRSSLVALRGRTVGSPPMTRVFSGIKPTGKVHLGNLLGALRRWVDGEHRSDGIYCIIKPCHPPSPPPRPVELRESTLRLAQILLAVGLDPDACTLFVQSHVPAHSAGAWLMESTASYGELSRMTQFKDKSSRSEFVSGGLFTYPALMAADILYDTDEVPVGDDQRRRAWNSPATSPSASTAATARRSWCPRPRSHPPGPGSWTSRTPRRRCPSPTMPPPGPS